ncbi:hypothetical protein CR513_22884, partial [Mucuna pruriens]
MDQAKKKIQKDLNDVLKGLCMLQPIILTLNYITILILKLTWKLKSEYLNVYTKVKDYEEQTLIDVQMENFKIQKKLFGNPMAIKGADITPSS